MMTSDQEAEAQFPKPYNSHEDIILQRQHAIEMEQMLMELRKLREALGVSLVWILQHPCDDIFDHLCIIRRIEKVIKPSEPPKA